MHDSALRQCLPHVTPSTSYQKDDHLRLSKVVRRHLGSWEAYHAADLIRFMYRIGLLLLSDWVWV
jgi:hypothetical protein